MSEPFRPWALDITTSPDQAFDLADALGMEGVMEALGITLFDAVDGQMLVQALYQDVDSAKAALTALNLPQDITGKIAQLPDRDWVSETQSGLAPVEAGRFVVFGTHDADLNISDRIGIQVDAGLAFGTGHHGTTAGCLHIFSDLLDRNVSLSSVLDLGCGAGVLAIAAAKTLPERSEILATDIDVDAVNVTRDNAAINGVSDRLRAHQADGFDSEVLQSRQFDLIFANILAGPLMGLASDIVSATAPDGYVILSGILDELAPNVAAHFRTAGLHVTPQPSREGWTSLLAQKRT